MPVKLPPDRNDLRPRSSAFGSIRVSMREAPVPPPTPVKVNRRFPTRVDTVWMVAVLFFCLLTAYAFGSTRVSWVKTYPFFARVPVHTLK